MRHKLIETADLKINNDGPGTLSGYASTFEPWDRVREKPAKGAFSPYLAAFLKDGFIAYGHDWGALPIATPTDAGEDSHGLYFSAEFHSTTAAQEARIVANERLARGKSVSTSIGYDVLDSQMVDAPEVPGGKGKLLKLVPLYEISLVTVPANPAALLTGAKGAPASGVIPFDLQARSVESAVRAFAVRAQRRMEARQKAGRPISAANRQRIFDIVASLQDLLALTEPKTQDEEAPTDEAELAEVLKEYYALQPAIARLSRR